MNFVFDVLLKLKNGATVYLDVVKFEHSEFFYIFHCPEPDGSIYVWKEFRDDVNYYVVRCLQMEFVNDDYKTFEEFECVSTSACTELQKYNADNCESCDKFLVCEYCLHYLSCEYVVEKRHCTD